jgi:hypothetical protein
MPGVILKVEITKAQRQLGLFQDRSKASLKGSRTGSIAPKVSEWLWGQLGVAHRMPNVLVAEIILDRAGIVPVAG